MQITPIPCLTDNYAYIINDNNSKIVGVVDPSEASPIISFLNKKNLKLNYILNTHHHFDHIGGNIELKKLYNAKVVGFVGDKHRIPGIDITLKDNEKWNFKNLQVKILHIPGHTLGHICFFFEKEKAAFTGDTLFSLGCGKIFEGSYNQMLKSLNRIKNLPKDTKIYCGHEYTASNAKFVQSINDNDQIKLKIIKIKELREKNIPTVPTTIAEEKDLNIFFQANQENIKSLLSDNNISDEEAFTIIRSAKDTF